jgi:hypothetical protein
MTDKIQELDQYPFQVTLTDPDGDASEPTTMRWKLDCKTTQTSVVEWVELSAAATVDVTVPASANAIIYSTNAYEIKRITVQANYDTDSQLNKTLEYKVMNNFAYS